MKQNYLDWLENLDKEQIAAITDRKVWMQIIATFVVIIGIASWAPVAATFFQLRATPPLLCLALVSCCAALVSSIPLRQRLSPEKFGYLMLITSALFQLFMWSLVCYSQLPGATVLAALPILLAAYHGEFFRFSAKYPWGGLAAISAIAGALILAPGTSHLAIISVGGLIAIGAAFTMGNHALLHDTAIRERDALKQAVDAQTLLDSVREIERTQSTLLELRGTNHDAGNALSGVLMNLEFLHECVSKPQLDEAGLAEIRAMTEDLSLASSRLRKLIEQGRETGKQADARESVNFILLAENVLDEVQQRYPQCQYDLNVGSELKHAPFFKLHGGELTLHRILLNLLKNAYEGNGIKHASKVWLNISKRDDTLCFELTDDGPGFASHLNTAQLASIGTTKQQGTGLGLYTIQRLIMANGGQLSLENRPEGGARIGVRFRLATLA